MSAERLTANERRLLHEGVCSRHRDNTPGVYVCRPCETAGDAAVEAILAARLDGLVPAIDHEVALSIMNVALDMLAKVEVLAEEWDAVSVDDEWDAADRWADAPAQLRAILTAAQDSP